MGRNWFGQRKFHFGYVKSKLYFRIQIEISTRYLRIRSRICELEPKAELWAGDINLLIFKAIGLEEMTQGERMNTEQDTP